MVNQLFRPASIVEKPGAFAQCQQVSKVGSKEARKKCQKSARNPFDTSFDGVLSLLLTLRKSAQAPDFPQLSDL